jgi:hypothetical protein
MDEMRRLTPLGSKKNRIADDPDTSGQKSRTAAGKKDRKIEGRKMTKPLVILRTLGVLCGFKNFDIR